MRGLAALALLTIVAAACAGPQAARTDRVRVFDDPSKPEEQWGYDPKTIQVAKGTTVTFTNAGTVYHTVTSDDATRAFDVGVDPGKTATIVFDKAGTWTYHCGIHTAMKGTVQVCDGACR
jgi:plastocyanin